MGQEQEQVYLSDMCLAADQFTFYRSNGSPNILVKYGKNYAWSILLFQVALEMCTAKEAFSKGCGVFILNMQMSEDTQQAFL